MDTLELVEWRAVAGRRVIAQLVRDGFEITAAFWVRTTEEDDWSFYIATPLVEQKRSSEAYRLLHPSLQRLEGIPLSLSDVNLVGAQDPITKDVLDLLARHKGRLATRYAGRRLGRMSIDGAYIYPSHLYTAPDAGQTAKDDVLRELLDLLNRAPDDLLPCKVILKAGDSFEGVPYSVQRGPQGRLVVIFIDKAEPVPRVVNVEDIDTIS